MTLAELRTELQARGFAHLSNARTDLLINRAYQRLAGLFDWPFTEDSAQGTAPLSIPTLRHVQAVTNESQGYVLEEMGYDDILEIAQSLSTAGNATFWYRSMPAGDPVVDVYPTTTDTIGVQFFAVPTDLSADADEPTVPARFHLLICDMAQQQAERDRGNYAGAQAIQPEVDRQIAEMVNDLLPQQAAKFTKWTGASFDA